MENENSATIHHELEFFINTKIWQKELFLDQPPHSVINDAEGNGIKHGSDVIEEMFKLVSF